MAIDQRDVSSTLRFMDDRALQQYAAMYKNDPYIFPLAFQESQNRQRLRMSQQSAQGMQPQPKVNEQALAQMAPQQLPEDQGIATLAAPNMQQMADGGIAGYDDADFVSRSEPVVMMAGGGHIPRYQGNPQDGSVVRARGPYDQPPASMTGDIPGFVAGTSIFQTQPSVDPEEPFLRRLLRERKEAVEAQRVQEARARAMKGQPLSAEDQARVANADKAKAVADTSAQDLAQFDAASNLYMTERAAKQAAAKPAPVVDNKAAPKPDTNRRNKPVVETAPAAAVTDPSAKPDTGGLDTLMAEYTRKQELAQGAARNADVQYASSLRGEGAKLVADEEKRIKDQVDPYKDREARLLKQEKGLEGMGDKYLGLALLQAGAAMMTTPGGIGVALGKGVQVGSERYIQGMEKINAAKDKFADARDRLDDLRLNRADMNARDIKDAKKEARTLERQAEALFYTGAREDLKMTNQGIATLFAAAADNLKTDKTLAAGATETDKKIKSAEKIAAIGEGGANARSAAQIAATLNTPDRLVFNQLLKDNGNDAVKAAEALQKMKVEKFNVYDSYSKYLAGFAGKDPAMVGAPESITKYASRFAALTPPAPVDTNKPTRP
jgi:hypothetical protein